MTPTPAVQRMLHEVGHYARRLTEAVERGTERDVREALADLEDSARQARTELSKPRGTT